MEDATLTVALILVACYVIYKYLTKSYDYWEKQNVPFVKPRFIVGSPQFDKPLHELEKEFYGKYGRIYGRFDGRTPVLTVADPELLKKILVQDFDAFQNHRDLKCNDPIMDNSLFILDGSDWKRVRNIVSPIFTGSKLKKMLPLLDECCDEVLKRCELSFLKNEAISCQQMFKRFVLSSVARCTFGIRITEEEEKALSEKSEKVFLSTLSWRTAAILLFPALTKLFRISLLNPESISFFTKFMKEVLKTVRGSTGEGSDFLQRIIKAEAVTSFVGKESHSPSRSEELSNPHPSPSAGLSRDEAIAQCVNFFMAGLDPTTSMLSHSLYEMALNEKLQERAVQEIKEVLSENENTFSYEAISQMKFLDAMMSEALRLCPSLVRTDRRVERDYTLDGTEIKLKKGMLISVPFYAMHRDPEFFPDPDTFNPERFLSSELKPPPYVHLPFGAGPRVCLGKRFVEVAVKQCLAKILTKYRVVLPEESMASAPLKIKEMRGTLSVEEVKLKFVPREY